jgi:hypothetical protein
MDVVTHPTFQLFFAPSTWSEAQRLQILLGSPYSAREVSKGVAGIVHHFQKFDTLATLVNRLIPTLEQDRLELERDGFSPSNRSREVAGLIEVLACELYAVLDGVRCSLFGVYKGVQGVQNKSTEKLFKRAATKAFGEGFPENIRSLLADAHADWFYKLRTMRTEVTHGEIGTCHLNPDTGQVSYIHSGLGTKSHALVLDDIVVHLNELADAVRGVVDAICRHLYDGLDKIERNVTCGIHQFLMYERRVRPEAVLTFHSGTCLSRTWFDKESGVKCPMRMKCGAYTSPAS